MKPNNGRIRRFLVGVIELAFVLVVLSLWFI